MRTEVVVDTLALEEAHISWLLIAAYTYLQQNMPEQAVTLLRFLRLFDRDNQQCLKMLAYAYVRLGRVQQSAELIEEVLRLPLSPEERTAMSLMRRCVANGNSQEGRPVSQDSVEQLALTPTLGIDQHDS